MAAVAAGAPPTQEAPGGQQAGDIPVQGKTVKALTLLSLK